MFPNLFLKTFWGTQLRPQIFVAMSFAESEKRKFENVIAPAIRGIHINHIPLQPYRVDVSKTGDSILTDIIDGIAHCQMFVADVSVIGHDSKSGNSYRSGNVMYEVGLAVASRQPTEILLLRDDRERFLFDVSTIPHIHLDFADVASAQKELQERIIERLRERDLINDARTHSALASLTSLELSIIEQFGQYPPTRTWGFKNDGTINFREMGGIPRLCDKQLIELVHGWKDGGGAYRWTEIGWAVAKTVLEKMPRVQGTDMKPITAPPETPSTDQDQQK